MGGRDIEILSRSRRHGANRQTVHRDIDIMV